MVRALKRDVQEMKNRLGVWAYNGLSDLDTGHGLQRFGGGKMRIDRTGMQINAGDNEYNAITFIDEFQKTKAEIDAHYPRLTMSGNLNPNTLPNFFNFEGHKSSTKSVGIEYQLDAGLGMYMYADNGGGMWADLMLTLVDGSATIASGAITASKSHMRADTQSSAATDDLDTINFGDDADVSRVTGSMLLLRAANTARTVVVKHNTGNIWLADATDYSLDDDKKAILLVYDETLGLWCEIARAGGGGSSVKTPVMITPWSRNALGIELGGAPSLASATWPTANLAIYVPFALDESVTVVKGFWHNGGAVSGNVDIGIYNEAGTKQVSIGSTAQSGTDVIQEVNIADTPLTAGRYYMALACDNTTATFRRVGAGATAEITKTFGIAQQASAFALPASATLAVPAQTYLPLFGFSLRALVA